MTITAQSRQTLFDVAIQHCGSIEAAFTIASLNNIAVTSSFSGPTLLSIPAELDKKIVNYYAAQKIVPATELEA